MAVTSQWPLLGLGDDQGHIIFFRAVAKQRDTAGCPAPLYVSVVLTLASFTPFGLKSGRRFYSDWYLPAFVRLRVSESASTTA